MKDRILTNDERKSIYCAILQLGGMGHPGEVQTLVILLCRDEFGEDAAGPSTPAAQSVGQYPTTPQGARAAAKDIRY